MKVLFLDAISGRMDDFNWSSDSSREYIHHHLSEIANIETLESGDSLIKYTGNYNGTKCVIRFFNADRFYGDRFDREGAALRAVNRALLEIGTTRIRVPQILYEADRVRVVTWEEGEDWSNYPDKILDSQFISEFKELMWKSGQYFDRPQDAFSDLSHSDQVFLNIEQNPVVGGVEEDFHAIAKEIRLIIASAEDKDRVLVHGDFHELNILWKEQTDTYTLLDWEYATLGNPEFDLAYFSMSRKLDYTPEDVQIWNRQRAFAYLMTLHWCLLHIPEHPTTADIMKKTRNFLREQFGTN